MRPTAESQKWNVLWSRLWFKHAHIYIYTYIYICILNMYIYICIYIHIYIHHTCLCMRMCVVMCTWYTSFPHRQKQIGFLSRKGVVGQVLPLDGKTPTKTTNQSHGRVAKIHSFPPWLDWWVIFKVLGDDLHPWKLTCPKKMLVGGLFSFESYWTCLLLGPCLFLWGGWGTMMRWSLKWSPFSVSREFSRGGYFFFLVVFGYG